MLILFPFLTGLVLFILLSGIQQLQAVGERSIRKAFIETQIILSGFIALSSEVLGILKSVNVVGMLAIWALFLVGNLLIGWKMDLFKSGWKLIRSNLRVENKLEMIPATLVFIVLAFTLLTGLASPPNNYDSLLYHLPRVAHWIQNGSLAHYATSYINQLAFPIFAEEGILSFWLLWGSDALSSCVQWLAFGSSLVAVSYLAKNLGASRRGEWLAVFFALSLPSVLLQSSSTQNDLVTGFWFLCFLVYLVILQKRSMNIFEKLYCGGCLGLGMLTKGTFYPFVIALLVYLVILIIKREVPRKAVQAIILIAVSVIVLNAGYWIRNIKTFKTPLGTSTLISSLVSGKSEQVVYLNPIRNLAGNFVTPYEKANYQLFGWLFSPPGSSGTALPSYWMVFAWNDEDYAGNPVHLVLMFGAVLSLLFLKEKNKRIVWVYTICIFASFIFFSISLRYNAYLNRLEIPFFLSAAPVFGFVAAKIIKPKWASASLIVMFFIIAMPWCLINKTRPLIALRENPEPLALPSHWVTGNTAGSILLEPDTITFFAHFFKKHDPYIQMTDKITSSECHDIGLRIDSSDPEYPFWWLLSAPQSGYHLESQNVIPETNRYMDPRFSPCAVICTICDEQQTLFGLDLAGKYDNATLYLSE